MEETQNIYSFFFNDFFLSFLKKTNLIYTHLIELIDQKNSTV